MGSSVNDELSEIYSHLQTNSELAIDLALELKDKCENSNNYYGLVKANYYLGYLHEMKGAHGKAVIFYLEALRNSEKASYNELHKDQISLNKNLGNIFRKYNAFTLATTYNFNGIELASNHNDTAQLVSLKFNESLNLKDQEKYNESIDLFESIYQLSNPSRKLRILNELGLLSIEQGNLNQAISYFNKLILQSSEGSSYRFKALHNLGNVHFERNSLDSAIHFYLEAISLKENSEKKDLKSLFLSYKAVGELFLLKEQYKQSEKYLSLAEEVIPSIPNHIEHFKLYELCSYYNYAIGNSSQGKYYSDLYSTKVDQYLITQSEIQESDQKYNMDLITERYFAEVDKQESIAEILMVSKLTSGGLLALLLMVIGYHRYKKISLRKSIERELMALNLID